MNQLEALKKITKVVIDSGDIECIAKYSPEDATTNPTLILHAISSKRYDKIINQSIDYAKKNSNKNANQVTYATDKIIVLLGVEILKLISGKVSVEIDACLSFNKKSSIDKAMKLIHMFEEEGVDRSRVLIKVAATWEGIQVAKKLEKQNIHCNLTLLFSFAQAQACADAGVFLISPFVGRIYDWHHRINTQPYRADRDPGVKSVYKIYNYYKQYNYSTIVMGASFRNKSQVLALAGCDRLTISPNILEELKLNTEPVECKLFQVNKTYNPPIKLIESEFRWLHNQDVMAVEKLSDGIRNFNRDQIKLQNMLQKNF